MSDDPLFIPDDPDREAKRVSAKIAELEAKLKAATHPGDKHFYSSVLIGWRAHLARLKVQLGT